MFFNKDTVDVQLVQQLLVLVERGTEYRGTPTGPVTSQIVPQVLELPSAVPDTAEIWTRRIFIRRVHSVQLYNWGLSPAVNIVGAKRFPGPEVLFKPPCRFESHDGYRHGHLRSNSCTYFPPPESCL